MFSLVNLFKKVVHTVAKVVKKTVSKAAAVVKKVAAAIVNIAAPIRVSAPSGGGGGGGSSAGRPSATSSPASGRAPATLSTAHVPINFTKMAPASLLRGGTPPTMASFNVSQGVQSALDYAPVGMITSIVNGCAVGAAAGSFMPGLGTAASCLMGAGIGDGVGSWAGAIWGFLDGGAHGRDRFDGIPDLLDPLK